MQKRHVVTLVARYERPARRTMRWSDVEALLRSLGVVEEREGSRVAVTINGCTAVFHRPHPSPEIRRLTIRDVAEFLRRAGVQMDAEK
jgi:HicA toxin of bacterial toxin-antitoxin,